MKCSIRGCGVATRKVHLNSHLANIHMAGPTGRRRIRRMRRNQTARRANAAVIAAQEYAARPWWRKLWGFLNSSI